MNLLMVKMLGFFNMLGSDPDSGLQGPDKTDANGWWMSIVEPILSILRQLLVPLIIILATAGTIYAIILGVQFIRAESADKRDEAKKRMINAIIGIVLTVILLTVMLIIANNSDAIAGFITENSK